MIETASLLEGWGLRSPALAAGVAINLVSFALLLDRARRTRRPTVHVDAKAAVILPLTGDNVGLERLVDALNRQTLAPHRLIVAVESTDDPAYARALSVRERARFPLSVVVAGPADHNGQKCWNQQAALGALSADDEVIVFMDADAQPQDWWLSALVSPIAEGVFDLVSGRRWMQVEGAGLGTHMVAAIDRRINLFPQRDDSLSLVIWGGSVALSRAAADAVELDRVLDRTLSDDLSLADAARHAGLRVLVRGALLVPSPIASGFADVWRFGRRQYQICRIYRPRLWWLAALVIHLRLLAWGFGLAGLPDAGSLAALAAMALLGGGGQLLIAETARRVGLADSPGVRLRQAALGAAQPLVDLFHATLLLGAARTRVLSWSHVDYVVDGPRAIRVRGRRPFAPATPRGASDTVHGEHDGGAAPKALSPPVRTGAPR